eukprot:5481752-Alexandrium_andersonii.AAC.1
MCIRDRFRADPESAEETGRRARRRRFTGVVLEGGAPLGSPVLIAAGYHNLEATGKKHGNN